EKSVVDLIDWHIRTKTPVSSTSGAKLKNSIERPPWILNHDSVKTVKKLGEGAFGEVYMADLVTEKGSVPVAVKTMREEISRDARLKFMKEARLMRKFRHEHVVLILGIAVHEHPLMLVMELCLGGSVLSYLRKQKGKTTLETKMRFVLEASSGLAYLEEKSCIHRDIAARNCLLTEKHTVKISDFGMSSERKELTDEKLDKVPVKWDVWSFGVLCYEVYADGAEPYPGLTNIQTRAKIVVQNYRMDMPKDTPSAVTALVTECWAKEPGDRPAFSKILDVLSNEFKIGKTTLETKMRFVLEASSGLAYLEEKSCIHRDIAARNCLLTEKHTVKISDFGMSSERKELTDEKLDKVPVKWLAPETMQKKIYSSK
uniref:Protein kinase domain-containing protein n=1 Tax=Panagrolaimus sp. ES5 TaxID=591445 RepID=A0AC34G3X3_9BILA